jgi:poly(3-hydroxybutyrate) depolymerase
MIILPIRFLAFWCILSFIYADAKSQDNITLTQIENFGTNQGNLKMFVHLNVTKDSGAKPLVVVLHGCGQNANDVASLTGWNKLADSNNFIVLYPQQRTENNISHCFNWFQNKDIEKGKGESASIFEMITYLHEIALQNRYY